MRTRIWTVRTLIVVVVVALATALSGLSEARADVRQLNGGAAGTAANIVRVTPT
jgi:hypothetical protein